MFPDANCWTEADYRTLIVQASTNAFRPEDLLCVMSQESGLIPRADECDPATGKRTFKGTGTFAQFEYKKNGKTVSGARGLTQMMPKTLLNLGFKAGDVDFDSVAGDYRQLSVSQQLVWAGKYFANIRAWKKVKSYTSPGDLYLSNFLPDELDHKDDPFYHLVDQFDSDGKENISYRQNIGFDDEKKGWIGVYNVAKHAARGQLSSVYHVAVTSLNYLRQYRLNDVLYQYAPLKLDGKVGPETLMAVKRFRYAASLPADGGFDGAVDGALFP